MVRSNEFARYLINGFVATFVHYASLNVAIYALGDKNLIEINTLAAFLGILVSFIGSRYFVFKKYNQSVFFQLVKFFIFYIFLSILHSGVMYIFVYLFYFDYRLAFIPATVPDLAKLYG